MTSYLWIGCRLINNFFFFLDINNVDFEVFEHQNMSAVNGLYLFNMNAIATLLCCVLLSSLVDRTFSENINLLDDQSDSRNQSAQAANLNVDIESNPRYIIINSGIHTQKDSIQSAGVINTDTFENKERRAALENIDTEFADGAEALVSEPFITENISNSSQALRIEASDHVGEQSSNSSLISNEVPNGNFRHSATIEPNYSQPSNAEYFDFEYDDLNNNYNYSYDYHQQFDISQPEYFQDIILRKCHCDAQEIWNGTQCIHYSGTFVAVLDDNFIPTGVNSSWFGAVAIEPLSCPDGYTKTVLSAGDFNYFPDMRLFYSPAALIVIPELFCIDHILDASNDNGLSWKAEACIAPPSIPRCCPKGESFLSITKTCISFSSIDIYSPPLSVGKTETEFSNIDGPVVTLNCSSDKEIRWVKIAESGGKLSYTGEGSVFSWQQNPSAATVMEMSPDYCVAVEEAPDEEIYWASFCFKDRMKEHIEMCGNGTCVRKCCPGKEVYSEESNSCSEPNVPFKMWQPTFHKLESGEKLEVSSPNDLILISGSPLCKDFFVLEPHKASDDKFYLLQNGSLHVPVWSQPVHSTSYCVDHWVYENGEVYEHAMVCFPEVREELTFCESFSKIIYSVMFGISCFFLAITLIVYLIVPELHAKVHGKSLVSYVSALFVAYVSLTIVREGSSFLPMGWCIAMGKS